MYHSPHALWWWKSTAKSTAKKVVSKGLVYPIAKGLSVAPFMAVKLTISEKLLVYPSNFHSTFALPLPIFLCMVHGPQMWQIIDLFLCIGICNRNVKNARKGECMAVEAPEGTRRERDKRMTSLDGTAHHEDPRTSIYTWLLNNTQSGKTKDTLKERIDRSYWRGQQETQRYKRVCQQCCLKILRGWTRWRHTIHNSHPETSPWLPNMLTKSFFSLPPSPAHSPRKESSHLHRDCPALCVHHLKHMKKRSNLSRHRSRESNLNQYTSTGTGIFKS